MKIIDTYLAAQKDLAPWALPEPFENAIRHAAANRHFYAARRAPIHELLTQL